MLQLSFNQKVAFGFVIILVLLGISGVSSLWNLNDINRSNTRVNDVAVPVVREGNQVQIQLLKLANLSALGFNAVKEEDIHPYRKDFAAGIESFEESFERLQEISSADSNLRSLVTTIEENYNLYVREVNAMFDAKLAALVAKKQSAEAANELINGADNIAGALMEVVYYEPPSEYYDKQELVAGNANQADALIVSVVRTAQEYERTTDLEKVATAREDFDFIIRDSRSWFDKAVPIFQEFGEMSAVEAVNEAYDELNELVQQTPGLAEHKAEQLTQVERAVDKLESASAYVNKAVSDLDTLLASANSQFNRLQGELENSLDFGIKSTLVILLILFALATQNFISMRNAIRRKMEDLAKLNNIGGTLAAARDQSTALEEVLHAMYDKIGIEQGSVYLFNKAQELEAKAFLPPMKIEGDRKAIRFTKGQGVIGRAAEEKKVIFVPDTSRDSNYVQSENEKARALLCVPLLDKDMLIGVMNFSGDVKKVNFADSDYEFASSVALSLVTTIKNIRMVEVIEEHNRNLEKKVEERTAALKQKNEDIANMLSNMHQGLFTIVEGGLIHPEYAAYLETIFETSQIANRNFMDLLFRHAAVSSDIVDQVSTTVASIVGEDSMMFEFNSHLLVNELTLEFPDKPKKLIELDWDPILSEDDTVTKLMVTVRDVTALKALQAEAEGQRQELSMIGEILAVDEEKFSEFLRGSEKFIDRCRTIITETKEKDPAILAELFRNMHTVKGNARTYALKQITETVHEVENTYDQLRKNEEMPWQPDALLEELALAEAAVQRYATVFTEKLGRGGDGSSGGAKLDHDKIVNLMDRISALQNVSMPSEVSSVIGDTYKTLVSFEAKPIDQVIAGVLESVKSLAGELSKPQPAINIEDGGLYIRSEAHSMLNNIFMHVFRNAMDHGIEKPEDRAAKGKPEQGTITMTTTTANGMASFAVRDDGRGIALTRIFNMAKEKGLYADDAPRPPAAEIANLIFASGFSTAEAVTEVSGRGVGMDAVRSFLESEGGSIQVVLDDGDELADFRSFATVLSIPEKFYIQAPRFAEAS